MARRKSDLLKPAAGSRGMVVGPVSCTRQRVPSSRHMSVLLMSPIAALASPSREAIGCWPRHTVVRLNVPLAGQRVAWLGACLDPPPQ